MAGGGAPAAGGLKPPAPACGAAGLEGIIGAPACWGGGGPGLPAEAMGGVGPPGTGPWPGGLPIVGTGGWTEPGPPLTFGPAPPAPPIAVGGANLCGCCPPIMPGPGGGGPPIPGLGPPNWAPPWGCMGGRMPPIWPGWPACGGMKPPGAPA